jgi:hypothetical protein
MALTPFFGSGRSSNFDPFEPGFWDHPVDPWSSGLFGKNLGKEDVQAVASTRIDWVETPEAHVFKADLPGKCSNPPSSAVVIPKICSDFVMLFAPARCVQY